MSKAESVEKCTRAISSLAAILNLVSGLLQIATIASFASIAIVPHPDYYILMALPLACTVVTFLMAAILAIDSVVLGTLLKGKANQEDNILVKCFGYTHKPLTIIYSISSFGTMACGAMGAVVAGTAMTNVSLEIPMDMLWFASMVVCFAFGLLAVIDSVINLIKNYKRQKKKVIITTTTTRATPTFAIAQPIIATPVLVQPPPVSVSSVSVVV